jgi:pimeloyl-ACP methyl ester carboxylesterase
VSGAGHVEDGFCSVYDSITALTPDGQLADLHVFLRSASTLGTVTIVGHSLGASVATLLALDVAVNDGVSDLVLYTLASPRTGDATFATFFDTHVRASWRVVNMPDVVPKLPPLYTHVNTEYCVDSLTAPVRHSVVCYHSSSTYLYLLDPQHRTGLGICQA